jgi:hypothetical protein
MIDPDKTELTLVLSISQINNILLGLQELPAKTCNPLTREIQLQANNQLEKLNKEDSAASIDAAQPNLEVVK